MSSPVLPAVAFSMPDSSLTTLSWFVYCKKVAAVNHHSYALSVVLGLPNIFTNCSSEDILVTSETGPYSKGHAIAPIDVAPAGTTLVKSTSLTCTPGETKNAMFLLPLLKMRLFHNIYKKQHSKTTTFIFTRYK